MRFGLRMSVGWSLLLGVALYKPVTVHVLSGRHGGRRARQIVKDRHALFDAYLEYTPYVDCLLVVAGIPANVRALSNGAFIPTTHGSQTIPFLLQGLSGFRLGFYLFPPDRPCHTRVEAIRMFHL